MNFHNNYNKMVHSLQPKTISPVQSRVWQHSFSYKENQSKGFEIVFERGFSFYFKSLLALALMIPLIISTGINIDALISDPHEGFMLIFAVFLNALRFFAAAMLFKYVRDAWRQVSYNSFDEMLVIRNGFFNFRGIGNELYHTSDIAGLEIRILEHSTFLPSGKDFDEDNPSCEVLMKLLDGKAVVLLPRVESIQAARATVYDISILTGLTLLTDIHFLYRQIEMTRQ
jgi:hypothetical protein